MPESTRELSDNFPLTALRLPTRIRNVLTLHGFKTVGDVRSASDKTLLSLPDLGPKSVAHLRANLGVDSRGEFALGLGCVKTQRRPVCDRVRVAMRYVATGHSEHLGRGTMGLISGLRATLGYPKRGAQAYIRKPAIRSERCSMYRHILIPTDGSESVR
jgi:Bacterial RNA polymerase, alpha chain C terminal domain